MLLKRDRNGFTLVELMIIILIVAILSIFSAPNFKKMMINFQLKSITRDLASNFQKARLEAVKRNTNLVTINFSPGAYNPQGFVGSYIMFLDDGTGGGIPGDGLRNGGEFIIAQAAMPRYMSLYNTDFPGNTTGFDAMGYPTSGVGTYIVCIRNCVSRYYKITLSPIGGIKLEMSGDGLLWIN